MPVAIENFFSRGHNFNLSGRGTKGKIGNDVYKKLIVATEAVITFLD